MLRSGGQTAGVTATFSAGVLLFRRTEAGDPEVLLGHMGGPFWARKDNGAWSIPKGEYVPDAEDAALAARREFTEELGLPAPEGEWVPMGEVHYSSGRKRLLAWAVEGDLDPAEVNPGTFEMEWPPHSGRLVAFPEIDRAEWFDLAAARDKLVSGQRPYLDRLAEHLRDRDPDRPHDARP
ncbi:NUDIX domain-containing protein [Nocardia sp. bgisy134]|uniref:NUDIX domain-containing protein n=1 Tax=unclassified Nocardia TaxID=2637762 RepID=UPI003D70D255